MNRPTLSRFTLSRSTLVPVVGTALTALLAGGVAWSLTGSTALLSVDGQSREVDFRGDTAADVVEAAGLSVGEHDRLVPAAGTEVADGETVSLRRGRELELVVDGKARTVWVTAASVQEALQQVGLREGGLVLSASRSRSIPLDGLRLSVTTPKAVSVVIDGKTVPRTSTGPTVRDALVQAGIKLDGDDRLTPARQVALTEGLVIRAVRIRTDRTQEPVRVPFATQRREDAALLTGTTRTTTEGRAGVSRRAVVTTYADGVLERRTVGATTVVSAPVARVVTVGTKPKPAVRQQSQTASGPRTSTGSAGGLNWAALAQCESGGNPRATNATGKYRGLYQFSIATWQGVGGQGDPIDSSSSEQTYRAMLLYNRSGAGQWPECGSRLFS